jgi:hypothetical protein
MEELINFARENDDLARTIAQNGYDFVRKLFCGLGIVDAAVPVVAPMLNRRVFSQLPCPGNNLGYDDVKSYWRHLLVEYTKRLDWDVVKHPDTRLITADKHRVVDKTT